MHKPIVFNRHLNDKWNTVNNEYMENKLQSVKSKVNSRCPKSFMFYKTQFNKSVDRKTKMQQYEISKNNHLMHMRLERLAHEAENKKIKQKIQMLAFKPNRTISSNCKFEFIQVAQNNQRLYKRITERKPFYSFNKWENDYEKHLYYKQNHCAFPSIDFSQNKEENNGMKTNYLKQKKNRYYLAETDQKTTQSMSRESVTNKKEARDVRPCKLFETTQFLDVLGQCYFEFSIQEMSFTIKIEPKMNKYANSYIIIFDTREAIENIQKYYKKYDEMIDDIIYDEKNDNAIFYNAKKPDLICKSVKLSQNGTVKNNNKVNSKNESNLNKEKAKELERQEELQKQKEIETLKEVERQKELERQEELQKQKELERQDELEKQKELERQEELQKQKEIETLKEVERQKELEKQKELERLKEVERQEELQKQGELQKKKELERQDELEKQKELERQIELSNQKEQVQEQEKQSQKELERQEELNSQKEKEQEQERQIDIENQNEMEKQSKQQEEKEELNQSQSKNEEYPLPMLKEQLKESGVINNDDNNEIKDTNLIVMQDAEKEIKNEQEENNNNPQILLEDQI